MKLIVSTGMAAMLLVGGLGAAPTELSNPDFTLGEAIPDDADHDWNLGATGARGWMHSHELRTVEARQVMITEVAKRSPAYGVLAVGDVLLGVAGKRFSYDPRQEIGRALTAAEASEGKLVVTRWREGTTSEVTISLPVLGSYSATAPYDCQKSEAIMDISCKALAKRMQDSEYGGNAITRSLNGLGLLASGKSQYHRVVRQEARWAADFSAEGMATWYYGYVSMFLAEYVMATGDKSVLPGLRRIALEAANGQSAVGSWGHKFAGPDGRLVGYGMMNSPGVVLTIGLVLAREAGVEDPEVVTAIERSARLLRFYIGKGAVPYGDHSPFMQSHEDNGKCGMAAVLFDQLGEEPGTRFFAKMSAASHGAERDYGHTGNFFNLTWAMPGVSRCGPHATGAWMQEFGSWYFDLARQWDGSFAHQGPPQARGDAYNRWDATGAYLIAYGMPRKAIRLTGKQAAAMAPLDAAAGKQVVFDGRGFTGYGPFTAHDDLAPDVLLGMLGSWSPIVRERAAESLARRGDLTIEPFLTMLDSPSVETRMGACTALAHFKEMAAPAVPKLREILKADDLWLRVKAVEALAAIGEPAMVAAPELLQMATMGPTKDDPRGMEQRYLAVALFSRRGGLLGNSLAGVDRTQLLAAVRSGLRNEDGRTRGVYSSVYENLSYDELKPLMPAIRQAILERSPSGVMFDGSIQTAGLALLSKHRVSEGIEMIADYVRLMKPHGSENHIVVVLNLLKPYGAHAQRAIPRLKKAIRYFENEEKDFPRDLSLQKAEYVRQAIKEIQACTDKPELRQMDR